MTEPIFVGCERELARLESLLGQALAGRGQVAFVCGEAGSGKTALVSAFTAVAMRQSEEMIVAVGGCSAQGRVADPYLPFREVLATLAGAAGEHGPQPQSAGRLGRLLVHSAQVLVEVGPDLIGTLIPGSTLLAKIGKVAIQKAGWMDQLERLVQKKRDPLGAAQVAMEQGRILEQYANVLKAMAAEHPLLLVIEDLHWADEASLGLFFHLSRRIETSRILLIGTYRPDEIEAAGDERHPLQKVLAEVKRYAGDVWVDLGQTPEPEKAAFVQRLLDSEPNRLSDDFREQMYRHTGGHPLFTVELLRSMRERGELLQDAEGCWTVGAALDWDTLPARVEGVIEERIGRLSETEREILDVASVQGQVFTAEVVGQIVQMQMRRLLKELSQELERQYRLVHEVGELKAGRSLLAAYRFAHVLFQRYLYDALGLAEKRLLHREVAQVLEELYAEQTDSISAQLAWHYDQAGGGENAAKYLVRSGELANAQGAPQAARQFFDRALEILKPPGEALELQWRALLGRHSALLRVGDPQALKADTEALTRLAESDGPQKQAEAAYRRLLYANFSGNLSAVLGEADGAIAAAQGAGDPVLEARGFHLKLGAYTRLGELPQAAKTAETALACARRAGDDAVLANVLSEVGNYHGSAGDLSAGVGFQLEALEVARRAGARVNEARILTNLGADYRSLGLYPSAQATLESALQAHEALGARRERAFTLSLLGLVRLGQGDPSTARQLLAQALAESQSMGDQYLHAACLKDLGYVYEQQGDRASAKGYFGKAQERFEALGMAPLAMEAVAGLARQALALGHLEEAQAHARALQGYLAEHGASSLPLEAHLACADVLAALGNPQAAREVLEGGYRDLIERAYKISDPEWRGSFLESVPENRQMLRSWQSLHNTEG
ncbi:MAG TPA: tetratricopeptide repeat protein [Meiothermus sp.]|nr:tetratricopeptide repeat protein [Meiothermus sp.]